MIKKILTFSLVLWATTQAFAQDGTASPYSFYGIGEVKFKGTNEFRTMGNLSILRDSIHLNIVNPASYSALKLTTFSVGASSTFSKLKNATNDEKAQRSALDYLAVAFPVNNFGFSFGLMPYTNVGYKLQNNSTFTLNGETKNQVNQYTGEGEINRAYAGMAYNVHKNISIGMNFIYSFGEITSQTVIAKEGVQDFSREKNISQINGYGFDFGVQMQTELKNKIVWSNSLSFQPEIKLTSKNSRNIAVINYGSGGAELVYDSRDVIIAHTKMNIPTKMNIGTGFGKATKWFVGLEYSYQENSKLKNRFDVSANTNYENSSIFALGGYYIPKYNSFTNYWNRVTYRGGFKYGNTGIVLNNQSIKDYGIDFGMGLPVGGSISNINIGFELGKRGTTAANLIQENYFNVHIGLSFNDKWFNKRKYN